MRWRIVAFTSATCGVAIAGFAGLGGTLPIAVAGELVVPGALAALLLGPPAREARRAWLPLVADALAGGCMALALPELWRASTPAPAAALLVASLLAVASARRWGWTGAGALVVGASLLAGVTPVLVLLALQAALFYGVLAEASLRGLGWGVLAGLALVLAGATAGALLSSDPDRAIRLGSTGFALVVVPLALTALVVMPAAGALLAQPRWARVS